MMKIFLLLFIAAISGCTFRYNSNEIEKMLADDINIVYLEDGTKCAVLKTRGGIDCNWSNSK